MEVHLPMLTSSWGQIFFFLKILKGQTLIRIFKTIVQIFLDFFEHLFTAKTS